MLEYYLNNKPLSISPGSSVRIIYYNPACYFKEIPGDVAMGIELITDEINGAILGNPERFEKYSSVSGREFPNFQIRFSGKLLLSGTLVIQTADKDMYSGWCRNNVGNLGKEHREKYIYDIPAFFQNQTFINKANYNPLTDPYGCPTHFNPEFFRDKGQEIELTRKKYNPDYIPLNFFEDIFYKQEPQFLYDKYKTELLSAAFEKSCFFLVNYLNYDRTVYTTPSIASTDKAASDLFVNVISPMLFLNFLIEMLFRDAHFFIGENAIKDHPDLSKLILYNNFDITNIDFVTEFKVVEVASIANYPDMTREVGDSYYIPPANLDPSNEDITYSKRTVESVQTIKRSYDATFKYRDLIPKIQLKDFILSIQNLLNVCFHFHDDGKVDIVDREKIIDSVPIDIDKYLVNGWNMGERKDITLKFLFSHDKDDILFSEKWEDIDDRRINEGDPVEKASDLRLIANPKMGEIRYVRELNIYSEYVWTVENQLAPNTGNIVEVDVLAWKHLSTGFQNGFFNRYKDEEEEIKTDFSTLFYDKFPKTLKKGNLETMKYAYETFTPRLLFYTGINTANNKTDNLSLDWEESETGLLAKRWSKWNRFWAQRQPVSIDAALTINMINYISRNITNRFRAREGEFIIETMETEYSLNTIGDTKISGYKNSFTPQTLTLGKHWQLSDLLREDSLLDFSDVGLNFDTDLDLFPFGL